MVTPEEREEIINAAVEKTILMIPEVIGRVIQEKVAIGKLSKKFYDDNKDFYDHKDLVASIISVKEAENPGKPYDQILDLAVPEIRKQIKSYASVNNKDVAKPDDLTLKKSNQVDNGVI